MTKGIDVSVWNGNIDWGKASKEIDFAIIRAGYGKVVSQKDKKFEKNYTSCINNGVKVGVYWYNYAKTITDAKAEAQACLAILNGRKVDMPIWYDVEEQSVLNLGRNTVSAIAKTFLEAIEAAGYKGGIYSSKSGLLNCFTDEVKNKYDVWLANVGSGGAALAKTTYSGHYEIWQYSWKGRINGISGDVDLDYCYKNYWDEEKKDEEIPTQVPTPALTPVPAAAPTNTINVFYRANTQDKWLAEVKNTDSYAGIEKKALTGFSAGVSNGKLRYRVHLKNGKWLGWIEKYDINDWNYGVAGIKGRIIDGIQFEFGGVQGYKAVYRVSTTSTTGWLPWVYNWDNSTNGYAGIYGKPIDKVQIKIEKV